MFWTQNLGMTIMPGASPQFYCAYRFNTYCGWGYFSAPCYWNYNSFHCVEVFHTLFWPPWPPEQCPGVSVLPGPVGPGDPVEALQALRKQLELALASVEAQERVLQEHRGGGGEEPRTTGGTGGRTPERKE